MSNFDVHVADRLAELANKLSLAKTEGDVLSDIVTKVIDKLLFLPILIKCLSTI